MSKPTAAEQIEALAVLRNFLKTTEAYANNVTENVVAAIETLDDADLFADLDQAALALEAETDAPRIPVAIVKHGPLFQAVSSDDRIWTTATTLQKATENLSERPEHFLVVTSEELLLAAGPQAPASEQTYNTPRCKHCSDPLGSDGTDLIDGQTFCGANPDNDQHEPEEA